MVASLNDNYPTIFGKEDKEGNSNDKGSDQEAGDEGSVEDDEKPTGFLAKWGFLYYLDKVAELRHETWDNILKKSIIEFLNCMAYLYDKSTWEQSEYRKKMKIKGY